MKNIKSQRGSITLLVVITVLFFIIITISVYASNSNTRVSQMQEIARIKEVYEADVDNTDEVYSKIIGGLEETDGSWSEPEEVNSPDLIGTGLVPIEIGDNGDITEVIKGTEDWYSYTESDRKWANAITRDGSMWVWIPRYAYKITYNNSSDKAQGATIDIVFLKDDTNLDKNGNDVTQSNYQDEKGQIGAYTVHPAFQDGTNNNFANGEWDDEIRGFWVSKFEAGYPEGNNNIKKISSGLTYSANNASSNFYGSIVADTTEMYYPVFVPNTYSYNNIIISDMYALCKTIGQPGNPYGFEPEEVDSHIMKNSEWGAIAYLTHSKYGRNGQEVTINNVNLNNSIPTINAVTGMAGADISSAVNITTIDKIMDGTSGSYTWETVQGRKASSTDTVYGVYDLSGGMYEYTSGYVYNGNASLDTYGYKLVHDGPVDQSTKYKTVYTKSSTDIHTDNYHQSVNMSRKGEAIWETSTDGKGKTAWFADYTVFPNRQYPFLRRGGYYGDTTSAGLFNFDGSGGGSGFHAIVVAV